MTHLAALLNAALTALAQRTLRWPGFAGIARPVLAAGAIALAWVIGRLGTRLLAWAFRVALMVAAVLFAYRLMTVR